MATGQLAVRAVAEKPKQADHCEAIPQRHKVLVGEEHPIVPAARLRAALPTVYRAMFKSQGLLHKVPCPDRACKRKPCLFSHNVTRPVVPAKRPASSLAAAAPSAKAIRTDASTSKLFMAKPVPKPPTPVASTSAFGIAVAPTSASSVVQSAANIKGLKPKDYTKASKIPFANRMQILQLFYEQFLQLYMALPTNFDDLAKRDAVLQEHLVYSASTKATYKGLAAQALGKLKKRPKAAGLAEGVGTNEALQSSKAKQVAVSKAALSMQQLQRYTLDKYAEERWKKDFILEIPPGISAPVTEAGNIRACSRCEANFLVKNQIDKAELIECPHHWGRKGTIIVDGKKRRVFLCCKDTIPCVRGPHVFQDKDPAVLHARAPFAHTASISSTTTPTPACALDCEMIYTTSGMSLARVTILGIDGQTVLLDEFIDPHPAAVLDYNTRFSGISEKELKAKAVLNMAGLHRALGSILHPKTLIIGHGIDNDLKAMRLIHPTESIIDTSMVFTHPAGPLMRYSLRNLTKLHLKQFIQDEGFHDSKQDAQATLDLLRFKIALDERTGV